MSANLSIISEINLGFDQVELGAHANLAAAEAVFKLYQERRPANTQRSQRAALNAFTDFMWTAGIGTGDLFTNPQAWAGITWGLVQAFQEWLLQQGYSVGTVNDRVSTVKVYMSLANQAGVIPDSEILRLQALRGFSQKEARNIDEKRTGEDIPVRRGNKKAQANQISEDQARSLGKVRSDSPQSRRDALIMCLLLDHGMRVSELAALTVEDIDLQARQINFYRRKTGRQSRHTLRGRALIRMTEYLARDQHSPAGPLLLASSKSGSLVAGSRLTIRAINQRVRQLGELAGIDNLSPHDCRHYGATQAGNDPNVSLAALMAWGGWESATSAARYIDRGECDNDGVSLGSD